MLVLLQIAHSQFEKIPAKIDRKLLFNIALVCEEYLCTSLVKAWIADWIIGTEMIIKQFTDNLEKDECLLIYWAFGFQRAFERLAWKLVLLARVQEGVCTLEDSRPLLEAIHFGIIGKSFQGVNLLPSVDLTRV